ncbi:MAG TPA: hypothetical protein VE092_02430 [Herbaspirillum sp.]|uniref:hypothetical protein n=1 Tax=Herbaspirillum sp. TaxID=1890675 RepID=UPI002D3DDBB4|nr:hypothetical protein [Herbaspirillum sp.]HZG18846.1 hypothetical protein [Herbaspirillum sp.]
MSSIDAPIRQYVEKIQALAVKALDGEDVANRLEQTVRDALHHFGVVVGVDKNACAREFRRQLNQIARLTHESQPAYRQAMQEAASHVPESSLN